MEVIKKVHEFNFGTAYQTYGETIKLDTSVRLQDGKYYLSKRGDIQVTSKSETYNSCVSPGSKFEYETDIMDMEPKGATSNTRYGLVAIDMFTNIAEVVPIINRTPEEIVVGLKQIVTSMETPTQLY